MCSLVCKSADVSCVDIYIAALFCIFTHCGNLASDIRIGKEQNFQGTLSEMNRIRVSSRFVLHPR